MKDEDEIGYGKPPVATQFSKGKSGNPKGRPRKHPDPNLKRQHTTSIVDDLRNELQQVTIITEAGKTKKITKQQAFVKSLVTLAIKGNSKAVSLIWTLAQQYGWDKPPDGSLTYTIKKENLEGLEAWLEEDNVFQD